jgi:MATE family multidrug resistance protein
MKFEKALLRLSMPIVAVMISRMAITFIDFIMVSQLGTEAQAAISPAGALVFAVCCIGMGIATSVQTFASQADGRREPAQGSAYAWQALYLTVGLSLLVYPAAAGVPAFFDAVGRLAQLSPEVKRLEIDYTEVALWAFIPSTFCAAFDGFFNGIRKPKIGFYAILVSLFFNIAANYALIFGHWGFPAMGIRGAAVASVLAWWLRAVVLAVAFILPPFRTGYSTLQTTAISLAKMAGLCRIGVPSAVQWLIDIGAWTVFLMLIVPLMGTHAMAATNIAIQFMHLSFMPAAGLGIALCSQVGFSIGSGNLVEVRLHARAAFRLAALYMGAIGLVFYFARIPLMESLSDDPAVIEVGALVLIWAAVFQFFDAMGITYINALRGAGDTRWPAYWVAFCCWVIFIGGGWTIGLIFPGWGVNGPWAMCTLYITVLGLGVRWRFRRGAWEKFNIFQPESTPSVEPIDPRMQNQPAEPL